MSLLDYSAVLAFFTDATTVASAIVALCGAVTAVVTATRMAPWSRRQQRAEQLKIGWRVESDTERTGALAHNDSKAAFEDVMLTVTCGIHGREARQDVGVLGPGRDYLWTSDSLHQTIDSRSSKRGVVVDLGPTHAAKPHGVQATFGDGKGYWFRDSSGVERVKSLVIWAEKTRAATLTRYFGHRSPFRRTYQISVTVQPFERTEELERAFVELAETSEPPPDHEVPDLVVGPHDWIGRVVLNESVIEPPLNYSWLRQFDLTAIEALSKDERLYGVPYVFDTVALVRNDTLTGRGPLPNTLADVITAGAEAIDNNGIKDGVELALQVGTPDANGNAGDPYHMWPLFASAGGSFFGLNRSGSGNGRGAIDRFDDITAWREDFADAFVRLSQLGVGSGGSGVLRPTVGRAEALQLFLDGRAPFLLCSSRALVAIRTQRLNVTVGVAPQLGNRPARPMVSVYGLFIYSNAPNLPAARDLVTSYVSQPNAGMDLNRFQQLVPVQKEAMSAVADDDPLLKPYVDQCRGGLIMPSYPEMRAAWQLLGRTEYQVLAGDGDPRAVAETAADAGWELLAQARAGR